MFFLWRKKLHRWVLTAYWTCLIGIHSFELMWEERLHSSFFYGLILEIGYAPEQPFDLNEYGKIAQGYSNKIWSHNLSYLKMWHDKHRSNYEKFATLFLSSIWGQDINIVSYISDKRWKFFFYMHHIYTYDDASCHGLFVAFIRKLVIEWNQFLYFCHMTSILR